MDSTLRTPYNPQAPLASTSSGLESSTTQSTMATQAQTTLEAASNVTKQVFTSPTLQPASFSPQTSAPPKQPLSQAISNTNPGAIPTVPASNAHGILPMDAAPPAPVSDAYPHQINGLGGPTATAPFLQDFSLVAEAAKRAQMGIVMRDLESVTL